MKMMTIEFETRYGGKRNVLAIEVTNITELREVIERNGLSYTDDEIAKTGEVITSQGRIFIRTGPIEGRHLGLWECTICDVRNCTITKVGTPMPLRPRCVEYGGEDDGC